MRRTLKRIKEALRRRRHDPVEDTAKWLGRVIDGWLNYYAVPTSLRYLHRFIRSLRWLWWREMRRRSQKDRFDWAGVDKLSATFWPGWNSDTRGRTNDLPLALA